jgi:uncharacterized protein YndB with AHSA1/START domain
MATADDQIRNRIEQTIDLDAPIADVWHAVTEPGALADWLGADVELDVRVAGTGRVVDDDGTVRAVLVTDVEPCHRLAWHWWSDDDELSSVELTLEPLVDATRVRVVEVFLPVAGGSLRASASASSCRWSAAFRALARGVRRSVVA